MLIVRFLSPLHFNVMFQLAMSERLWASSRQAASRMEPWGFEPQIQPCHGRVIPFHYGPDWVHSIYRAIYLSQVDCYPCQRLRAYMPSMTP
jgi:hypothetical protein